MQQDPRRRTLTRIEQTVPAEYCYDPEHYRRELPGFFMAAHPDYIRAARIMPRGPEKIELRMEWLFEEETLRSPDFDLEHEIAL